MYVTDAGTARPVRTPVRTSESRPGSSQTATSRTALFEQARGWKAPGWGRVPFGDSSVTDGVRLAARPRLRGVPSSGELAVTRKFRRAQASIPVEHRMGCRVSLGGARLGAHPAPSAEGPTAADDDGCRSPAAISPRKPRLRPSGGVRSPRRADAHSPRPPTCYVEALCWVSARSAADWPGRRIALSLCHRLDSAREVGQLRRDERGVLFLGHRRLPRGI